MEEGVPGPIWEFDEAEAFLAAEPFHHAADWRARGCLEPGFTEPGSSSEGTGLHVVGFNVEVATPRITEILMSHFSSWKGDSGSVRESDWYASRATDRIGVWSIVI